MITRAHFKEYNETIRGFAGIRVLVIGDFMLDVYLKGASTRLTPEAPVPVVDIRETTRCLGGAANTACNLRALGATVSYCTVIGADMHGDEAIRLLSAADIDTSNIIRDPHRETMVKTRVVSGQHLITRVDQGSHEPLIAETRTRFNQLISKAFEQCDAVIVSDYDKGLFDEHVLQQLITLSNAMPKFIAIDSKRLHLFKDVGASVIKPNYEELLGLTRLPRLSGQKRVQQVIDARQHILSAINAKCVLVTLDADGCLLLRKEKDPYHCAAPPVSNASVSGAGDTFLSAFTLSYLASEDYELSAEISTIAAYVAISKDVTASCTWAELSKHFNSCNKNVHDLDELAQICEAYRRDGKRIVFTNGCFDILHSGHVTYLHCAKDLGDVLIVGLNSDESIRRLKGSTRPINSYNDRVQVLAGLASVDHVVPFGDVRDDTPIGLIRIIRPDFFVKGGDYREDDLPEANTVRENGGEVVLMPHIPDHSTTLIISKINSGRSLTSVNDGKVG
jgi:D-beta-D-heptose 7-phosphate kinase / D-beta-D-heptose 1-phosphate adenosyltransferase